MQSPLTISTDAAAVHFVGALNIYGVDAARTELLTGLASRTALTLDLSGVTACDAAGLQLVIAARRAATLAGKSFSVPAPAPAVAECGDLLGIPQEVWRG